MQSFGKQKLKDFYLDPTFINVNHGSFGACPREVLDYQRQLQLKCESKPEFFFRVFAEPMLKDVRGYVSTKINSPSKNVFITTNATQSINCLAKSLKWVEGDVVLLPSTAYKSIRKTFLWLKEHFNIVIEEIKLTLEDLQTPEAFQMKVENYVKSYPKKIKLTVLDHIISTPGFVCPVTSLVKFFREQEIPLFIDGSHAIGQEPIDMEQMQPDAYFSNFHKWGFAPKSAALLYISDKYIDTIKPAVTGNYHGEGSEKEFFWCGTKDITAFLCVQKGLEYADSFGPDAIRNYNRSLTVKAMNRIAEIWGTKVLNSDERCVGYLANIEAPVQGEEDLYLCVEIASKMGMNDNCFPIFYKFDGKVYNRISVQIYNELSDFEFMATKFLEYLKDSKEGKKEETKKGGFTMMWKVNQLQDTKFIIETYH